MQPHRPVVVVFLLVSALITAGCSQPVNTGIPVLPSPAASETVPFPAPSLPPPSVLPAPRGVATTIATRQPLQLKKTVKETELLFSLVVPDSWELETERLSSPNRYTGLSYLTALPHDSSFTILTYGITRGQDQDIRNFIRKNWVPKPAETTVVVNSITFDRFESTDGGDTAVAYVVRKASANEKGFTSWISCTITPSGRLSLEDCDALVATFRYLSLKEEASGSGRVIPHSVRT